MQSRTIGVFVTLALAILVGSLSAHAQGPASVRRLGVLISGSPDPERLRNLEAFRQGLHDLGWVEGQNLAMEVRWAEGTRERLPELAAERVQLNVEVIVTGGGGTVTRAAQGATRTIPIVMVAMGSDPVAQGFVASLAHPGGNITGTSALHMELGGKRLQLLKELVPESSRIAFLITPAGRDSPSFRETQRAAHVLGVELQVLEVSSAEDFESAFAAMRTAGAGAFLVPADPFVLERHHRDITTVALNSRLPAIYPWRMYPEAGGLMSYGPSLPALWRQTATYVDKILNGTKPAELPVEQPTTFELVINLKTAEALGLTIPPSLLFQADEVIR